MKLLLLSAFVLSSFSSFGQDAGTPDQSFHNMGIYNVSLASGDDEIWTTAMQSDGKIVFAGVITAGGTSEYHYLVARLNTNGNLDNTFSGDGKMYFTYGLRTDVVTCIKIQNDGKIIVGGTCDVGGSLYSFGLARILPNGILDSSFSGDGKATLSMPNLDLKIYSLVLQSDNKIVVAGDLDSNFDDHQGVIMRFKTDGTLDPTFSGDGIFRTPLISNLRSVALQSDGKIVAVGFRDNSSLLVRLNTDGNTDNGFGTKGLVSTLIGSSNSEYTGVAIQSDGKIVAGGRTLTGAGDDFCVARYTTNGTLDNTFSSDGIQTTAMTSDNDEVTGIAIQSDGKILAAGKVDDAAYISFGLARYNSSGTLDNTFSTDGKVVTSLGAYNGICKSIDIQNDGRIILAGFSEENYNNIAMVRYLSSFTTGTLQFNAISGTLMVYPNQIEKQATLEYTLASESNISIGIYNAKGQKIEDVIVDSKKSAGFQIQLIDMENYTAGNYFIRIFSPEGSVSIQIIK